MRSIFCLLLFLNFSYNGLAQSYSTRDVNALLAIKVKCDKNDSLKWSGVDYANWKGVIWEENQGTYFVNKLTISDKLLEDTLNISSLRNIEFLDCSDNNLSALKIDSSLVVKTLFCDNNQLSDIDINSLDSLETLDCSDNNMSVFTFNASLKLKTLYCNNNELSDITLDSLPNLEYLNCSFNEISSLKVTSSLKLKTLYSDNNKLSRLDFHFMPDLRFLKCSSNQLRKLNTRGATKLSSLDCKSNELDTLEFSHSEYLLHIDCSENVIESLDLSSLTQLISLSCNDNKLDKLDVSSLINLEKLNCHGNLLTKIDISNLQNLSTFTCYNNRLTFSSLKSAYEIQEISAWSSFQYSNQDSVFNHSLVLTISDSVDYSQESYVGSSETSFKWIRGDSVPKPGDIIGDLNQDIFSFQRAGVYYCEMTNPSFPNLTLLSQKIKVIDFPDFTWPKLSDISYSDSLSSSQFIGGSTQGEFSFSTPDYVFTELGSHKVDVNFIPNDVGLDTLHNRISIKVNPQYSLIDLKELEKIKQNHDTVNWSGVDYGNWNGVKWRVSGNEYKVTELTLSNLKMSGNLTISNLSELVKLECDNNLLQKVALSRLPKLKYLNLEQNNIDSLSLLGLKELSLLDCSSNRLGSLDLTSLVSLKSLYCSDNLLDKLDVSHLLDLENLYCNENLLTELDLSLLLNLQIFNCSSNEFRNINLNGLNELINLDLSQNKLPFSSLRKAYNIKPSIAWGDEYEFENQDTIFMKKELILGVDAQVDFSAEVSILDILTSFIWFKDDKLASPFDVTNSSGVFSFHKSGTYRCKMTNQSFPNLTLTTKEVIVSKQKPLVIWPKPSPIFFNETLLSSRLSNGIGDGTFRFANPDLKLIKVGETTVSVNFLPKDTLTYNTISNSVEITVNKRPQVITWNQTFSTLKVGDTINIIASIDSGNKYQITAMPAERVRVIGDKVLVLTKGELEIKLIHPGSEFFEAASSSKKIKIIDKILSSPQRKVWTVYPNPIQDVLHFKGLKIGERIRIYDVFGHLVFDKLAVSLEDALNLDFLDQGIYIIEHANQNTRIQKK